MGIKRKDIAVTKAYFILGVPLAVMFALMQHPFDAWAQSPAEPGQSPNSLQKNVSKEEAAQLNSIADQLRQIHHTAARLKKTAKELLQEFNRTDLKILEYDDYINKYIDDKPVAYDEQLYPYGFQNIGNTSVTGGKPLPARKSYVDYSVGQIEDLTKMLGQEAGIVLAECSKKGTDPRIIEGTASATASLSDIAKLKDQLVALTKENNYKKDEIVSCANSIVEGASRADSSLKDLFKAVHSKFQKN